MNTSKSLHIVAWGLSALVVVFAAVAWAGVRSVSTTNLDPYQLFPLFGLVAFSLMWAHYIVAAARKYFGLPKEYLKHYFEFTSAAVLIAILLHPGLLVWQLWRDGLGLPPESMRLYVGDMAYWALVLGIIGLLAFLAYEFRRIYGQRSWWRFVQYANDAAMILVFVHALRLGGTLQVDWYRALWYGYGVSFVAVLWFMYFLADKPRTVAK